MSPDAPWIERAIFYGLHLHNSWVLLPAASLACFAGLLLLRRLDVVRIGGYRSFVLSFGMLPLLIYSAKDVSTMLVRASLGTVQVLKYAYLVLGLPTLVLFIAASALLAIDRPGAASWWKAIGIVLLIALSVFQSLWLFEADASL